MIVEITWPTDVAGPPKVLGRVWTGPNGEVVYDEAVAPIVRGFKLPPAVGGGRVLSEADGEAFVEALPRALALYKTPAQAEIVED